MKCPDCGRLMVLVNLPDRELDFYHLEDLEMIPDERNRVYSPLDRFDCSDYEVKYKAIPLREGCSYENRLSDMIPKRVIKIKRLLNDVKIENEEFKPIK